MKNELLREIEITENIELKNDQDFNTVLDVINELITAGIIFKLANNCISACDLLQAMLSRKGVETEILEVQAIIYKNTPSPITMFVGFDNQKTFGQELDTHAIIITKTKIPMIVDISLGHLLPDTHPWIIESLPEYNDDDTLAEFKFKDFEINYKKKKIYKNTRIL